MLNQVTLKSALHRYWWVILLLAAGLAYLRWESAIANEARTELKAFLAAVKLGADSESVKNQFKATRANHLELREIQTNLWVIRTPLQLGARNWLLYISFRDSRVEGLRVRLQDSKDVRPQDAPSDRTLQ
jgi:hypothetical protein